MLLLLLKQFGIPRWTSASMGMATALILVGGGDFSGRRKAGAQLVGGMVEGDDDLEVLGFLDAAGGLAGSDAGGAQQGLIADFGDMAFEDLAGQGVDGDVGGLAEGDIDDVGFIDLHFGGDDGHVGEGHEGGTLGVLNADDHSFSFADGLVGDDAVEGSDGDGLVQKVLVGPQGGDGWVCRWPRAESGLGAGLGEGGVRLSEAGDIEVVGGFFGVEVLLGHDLRLEEGLGALVVEFLLLKVGFGVLDIGLLRSFRRRCRH